MMKSEITFVEIFIYNIISDTRMSSRSIIYLLPSLTLKSASKDQKLYYLLPSSTLRSASNVVPLLVKEGLMVFQKSLFLGPPIQRL